MVWHATKLPTPPSIPTSRPRRTILFLWCLLLRRVIDPPLFRRPSSLWTPLCLRPLLMLWFELLQKLWQRKDNRRFMKVFVENTKVKETIESAAEENTPHYAEKSTASLIDRLLLFDRLRRDDQLWFSSIGENELIALSWQTALQIDTLVHSQSLFDSENPDSNRRVVWDEFAIQITEISRWKLHQKRTSPSPPLPTLFLLEMRETSTKHGG